MQETIKIPDNLDLVARAQLGLHALTGTCNPELGYEPYHITHLSARPAYFLHWSGIVSGVQPKFVEALALLKCMTGSPDTEAEKALVQSLLDNAEEDGFVYDRKDPRRPWNVGVGYGVKSRDDDYANIASNGRWANACWYMYQLTGDETYRRALKRCAEKICDVAVVKDDYAYFPYGGCGNDFSWIKSGWPDTDEPKGPREGCECSTTFYQVMAVRGLMKWYYISGDERMADISRRLVNFVVKPKFYGGQSEKDPDYGARRAHWWGHTHGNLMAFRSIMDYAAAAGDIKACEFARDGYEWTRHTICPQLGQARGFEGCCTGDLPALAIQLTDAGMGDYWDDADHAIRNATAQAQITSAEAARKIGEQYDERPLNSTYGDGFDPRFAWSIAATAKMPGLECDENVLERCVGAVTHALMEGRYQKPMLMSCCTGNALQGFYYAWEASVRHSGGVSTVNLFFTRFSEWMDLISFLPYEGKVVIRNKTSKTINVRIPGGVLPGHVRVLINGHYITPGYCGRYLNILGLSGREEIVITYPLEKRRLELAVPSVDSVGCANVAAHFAGSTCIGLDGEGDSIVGSDFKWIRQYSEAKYRGPETLFKDAPYYVPPKVIQWH
ncbi:MAG: hypothetical protein LBH95_08335 [Oscillospiraceae bacterium]|jgi:hypothetical protein|nr:hypothetical protein [Oscillospiraceae bacterium]